MTFFDTYSFLKDNVLETMGYMNKMLAKRKGKARITQSKKHEFYFRASYKLLFLEMDYATINN